MNDKTIKITCPTPLEKYQIIRDLSNGCVFNYDYCRGSGVHLCNQCLEDHIDWRVETDWDQIEYARL